MAYKTQIQALFAHTKGEFVPGYSSTTPAHALLVHFPIAFNILAWCLDVVYGLIVMGPESLTARYSDPALLYDIARLSYFLLCAGLVTTVPAIMSGNIQLLKTIGKNGGIWEKDADGKQKGSVVPRIKAAITHAMMNNAIFVLNLFHWYRRAPTVGTVNVWLSFILVSLLVVASKMGTSLVFNYGIGLDLGRKQVQVDVHDI